RSRLATGGREDEVNHRPPEPEQQADGAGEIRDREMRALRVASADPRVHRLDAELGECLQPRQNRKGEALRHEELRGLRAPGDEKRGPEDARECPEGGERRASRPGQKSEYL